MKKLMAAAVFVMMGFAACMTEPPPERTDTTTATEDHDQSRSALDTVAATDLTQGEAEPDSFPKPTCTGGVTCVQMCVCARLWCLYDGGETPAECEDDLNSCKYECTHPL